MWKNRPPLKCVHRPAVSVAVGSGKLRFRPANRQKKDKPPNVFGALALILTLLIVFSSTGCWDKREIEDLAFLTAWGVDRQENGEILATAVIVKPFAIATSTGEGGKSMERPFWLASSSGRNMLEAMCNFATFTPRFLFCAHSRVLVFGEESAREGVEDILDFFERDREPRLTSRLIVAKGMTAAEFLKSEYEMVPLPPEGGLGTIENTIRRLGTTVDTNINDFLIMLEEEGVEPVAGGWEVIPKRPVPLEGELKREEIIQSPIIYGAAAFKGSRLQGWLGPEETRGLQWIRGDIRNTSLIVENPANTTGLIGVEVIRARSAVTPAVTKGKPHIQVEIELEGNIDDVQGMFDPEKHPELIKKIENRLAKVVEEEIKAVLHRCQRELNTDIFGFGAAINRAHPKEWKRLKDRWDTEFPRLEVSLKIKTHIRLSGLVVKTIGK